jgi:hypothetical protein
MDSANVDGSSLSVPNSVAVSSQPPTTLSSNNSASSGGVTVVSQQQRPVSEPFMSAMAAAAAAAAATTTPPRGTSVTTTYGRGTPGNSSGSRSSGRNYNSHGGRGRGYSTPDGSGRGTRTNETSMGGRTAMRGRGLLTVPNTSYGGGGMPLTSPLQQQQPPMPLSVHSNSGVPFGHVPAYLPGSSSLVEELDQRVLLVLRDGKHIIGVSCCLLRGIFIHCFAIENNIGWILTLFCQCKMTGGCTTLGQLDK